MRSATIHEGLVSPGLIIESFAQIRLALVDSSRPYHVLSNFSLALAMSYCSVFLPGNARLEAAFHGDTPVGASCR